MIVLVLIDSQTPLMREKFSYRPLGPVRDMLDHDVRDLSEGYCTVSCTTTDYAVLALDAAISQNYISVSCRSHANPLMNDSPTTYIVNT